MMKDTALTRVDMSAWARNQEEAKEKRLRPSCLRVNGAYSPGSRGSLECGLSFTQ
jgi:hypothetical protein